MKSTFKRLLSLALAIMMVATLLPVSVFADDIVYTDVADEAALLAAISEGKNPKLTAGFTLTAGFEIPAETTVTMDLNGQTLGLSTFRITVKGNLTILDSSSEKTGTMTATTTGTQQCILADTGSTLHLKGGTIDMDSEKATYCIGVKGTVTIENTTIDSNSTGSNAFCFYMTGGSLTINEGTSLTSLSNAAKQAAAGVYCTKGDIIMNGGTVYAKNTNTSTSYGIQMASDTDSPTLTINGGSVTAEHSGRRDARAIMVDCGTTTINGGTLTANTDGKPEKVDTTQYYNAAGGVYLSGKAKVIINDGCTITAHAKTGRAYALNVGASGTNATINGGTLNTTTESTYAGYGICCGGDPKAGAGGTLTVNGGTINATGSKASTYGIYATTKKPLTVAGGTINVDTTAATTAIAGYGMYLTDGTNATVTGGTFNTNTASGNAFGIYATITYKSTAGETSVTLDSTTPASLTVPATTKDITVNATSASSNAYGIYNEGITKLDSAKLKVTATSGYTATSGSTLKYVYGLINQNQMDVSAGTYLAQASSKTATKLQAFGLNNSAKTAKIKDKAGTEHTVPLCNGVTNITGGSLRGATTKATGAGVMTNNGEAVNISGTAEISGTNYAAWCYKAPINISGGTLSSDGSYVVRVGDGKGVCTVTGGKFIHNSKNVFTVGTGTLNLKGGTFVGDVGRGAIDITHMLDPDKYMQDFYGTVKEGQETPKFEVTANGETKQYISYWDAVAAVNADTTGNAKVKLLKDIYLGAASAFTTSVEVDLNGKTWLQSNGIAIDVNKVGTENDITRVVNGTIVNDYASVVIYVRAGGIQLDGVTAYGQTTMPVCYTAPSYANTQNNYVKNSNLITNRYFTFSYRTATAAQTDMDVLFENTNLINLYNKANSGEIFFTGWGDTTGQYTIGEGVNMYTVYNSSTLQRQNSTEKNNKGDLIIMTAGTETVKAVAAEGVTIHEKLAATSYPQINSILEDVNALLTTKIDTTPNLYLWTTEHDHQNGECRCGDKVSIAQIGDTAYATLEDALTNAEEGDTVILNSSTTAGDVVLGDNIKLDLNGKTVEAVTFTVYGEMTDGAVGGDALIKAESIHIAGDGFLPIYDNAAGGYRLYKHDLQELGHKAASEASAKFGFRLELANKNGYKLLADADNCKLLACANVEWNGNKIPFTFKSATLKDYAEKTAANPGKNYAIVLTVGGLDALGNDGYVKVTPNMVSETDMKVEGAGMTWTSTN